MNAKPTRNYPLIFIRGAVWALMLLATKAFWWYRSSRTTTGADLVLSVRQHHPFY